MRIFLFIAAYLLPMAAYSEDKLSLISGLQYTTGDYGASIDTSIWVVPVTLKYQTGPMTFRLASSWIRITGPGGVTPSGEPIGPEGAKTTQQGMGDVTTSLTWNLMDANKYSFGMDVGAKIKFGTADKKKSLGTGENDYALQVEVYKPVKDWYPFMKLGYSWRGDPAGIEYRNVWFGSIGTNYRLSKTYSVGGYYDWRQKLTSTGHTVSEATLYLNTRINANNKLIVYLIRGFSDASPDWGAGLSLNHSF